MPELTLVIGNKNYSSWSLRPWMLLKRLGLEFKEIQLRLDTPEFKDYLKQGALKPAFATGSEYVKWVEENENLHRDLMAKGGLLKK